jgi:uncharacterized membrane protein
MDEHIVVSRSALLEQIGGLIRALLFWLGGFAVAKGWLNDGVMQALIPIAMTLGAILWQQLRIRYLKTVSTKLADMLPNERAEAK